MNPFDLLHRKVQAYIYKQRWENFRPIQDEAIVHVTSHSGDLLICAPTASGKTEAAFLPIISEITENFSDSYKAVYISPLKALINDQFRRIDDICEEIGIPVTKWHGDISQTSKNKSLQNPKGILLITPESLEAMLLNKITLARTAFSNLKYVVIDEVHSFSGTERGAQLLSLLSRIQSESNCAPTRVALSATIGNPEEVARWFSENGNFKVIQDDDWNDSVGVQGLIKGFTSKVLEDGTHEEDSSLYQSILKSFSYNKNLIFGNSKQKLEQTGYIVNQIAEKQNIATDFLIHHGSLAKNIRETAETEIKTSKQSISIFCTSTLEMGIDIGAIEKVGLIDPPWSVSGFAQRLGRSGRREGSSKKFEFFISQEELTEKSSTSELLREDLIKSVALVLLYLENFKEPLDTIKVHYSTMTHQILAYCLQKSGASLEDLKKVILNKSFKEKISESHFTDLINHLIHVGFLFKDTTGLISPGKIGEKLVEHYEFYSVFQTTEQWNIVCDGTTIGQIPVLGTYKTDDCLLLAGKIWKVVEVVDKAKRIVVIPSKKGRAPLFSASYGITHKKIHQKMREIYLSEKEYKFLDAKALRLLSEGRHTYKNYFSHPINMNQTNFEFFEGSKIQTTISNALKILGIVHGYSEVVLEINTTGTNWINRSLELLSLNKDAKRFSSLLKREFKLVEKYDHFLSDDALDSSFASSYLDIDGAIEWLNNMLKT